MLTRRTLLKSLAATGLYSLAPFGLGGFVAQAATGGRRLVVVLLRGAVDGLSLVVPYGDANYYKLRTTIALQPPGTAGGSLDLDGHFGLHPALAPLMPLWQAGQLGFVLNSGSTDETRSHFDAQQYMESGTPGIKSTNDGWLNRLLGQLPGTDPTRAISFDVPTPAILGGRLPTAGLPLGENWLEPDDALSDPYRSVFDALYGADDPLSLAFQDAVNTKTALQTQLAAHADEITKTSGTGATGVDAFALQGKLVGNVLAESAQNTLAFMSFTGWDTHVNQGNDQGTLAKLLSSLGTGLANLATGLGAAWGSTVVVVMSEFGRTARENGNRGTDHGHGNVMWLLGGPVSGGQFHGDWLGLDESSLHEDRDLPVSTDFRAVLSSVLTDHLGMDPSALGQVFPGFHGSMPGTIRSG